MTTHEIGQEFVTAEEWRVSLVKIVGTRKNAQIQRIGFLSETISDASELRELVKKKAEELKILWNLSFHHGKIILPCNIKKPSVPKEGAAVLGGDSKIQAGSLVLGEANTLVPKKPCVDSKPSSSDFEPNTPELPPTPKKQKLPTCPPVERLKKDINRINGHWGNREAKFKEFLKLKSGRDEFSKLRGEALLEKIPELIQNYVSENLDPVLRTDTALIEKIYRWWLRGLRCEAAIRKCQVDTEIKENAIKSYFNKN